MGALTRGGRKEERQRRGHDIGADLFKGRTRTNSKSSPGRPEEHNPAEAALVSGEEEREVRDYLPRSRGRGRARGTITQI